MPHEVRVILQDAQERVWFNQFMDALDMYRVRHLQDVPAQPAEEAIREAHEEAAVVGSITPEAHEEAAVVGSITPEGVKRMQAEHPEIQAAAFALPVVVPTTAQLSDALRSYLEEHKLVKTKALLDEFGVKKITDELEPSKAAELYARLTK